MPDPRAFRNELASLRFDDELPARMSRDAYRAFCDAVLLVLSVVDQGLPRPVDTSHVTEASPRCSRIFTEASPR